MISMYGLETILSKVNEGRRLVTCNGLANPVKCLLVGSLSARLDKPLVVALDKASRAEEFFDTLSFFMPDQSSVRLLYYPPWEILPYEQMSPHPQISGQRLKTLVELGRGRGPGNFILVTTLEALARRVMPKEILRKSLLKIEKDDSIDLELLSDHLVMLGYRRVAITEERGEFSIRGNIVDIFGGAGDPARIELFGDNIESIRHFNPDSQRSTSQTEQYELLPFRELFYEGLNRATLIDRFTKRFQDKLPQTEFDRLADLLGNGSFFSGMERHFPLFHTESETVFDYLPDNTSIIVDEPEQIDHQSQSFTRLIEDGYNETLEKGLPDYPPEELLLSQEDVRRAIDERTFLQMGELPVSDDSDDTFIITTSDAKRYQGDVAQFMTDLDAMRNDGYVVALTASSAGGIDRLTRMLKEHDIGARLLEKDEWSAIVSSISMSQPSLFDESLFIVQGSLSSGFIMPADKWAIVTKDEIFGKLRRVQHRRAQRGKPFTQGAGEIEQGDYIVHHLHGIGRFIGAKEMMIGDVADEYLELEYADNQRLYIPMQSMDVVRKYTGSGAGSSQALDKMGGSTWKKTTAKVKKSLLAMADKLLKVHAARELAEGTSISADTSFHQEFADSFEFDETEDQAEAIADVTADMERPKAMDRLICGDVGYGKTEVAMRAAFKAAFDGKQVAMVVPTTLLAQQHYQTFVERFKAFPINIEVLSRFRSRKEQKEILDKAKLGEVDIIIGTHRLLQRDVGFKDLGLIIIDEEQRFGVKHKEKLRNMRKSVDVLTLTATPIPRTLHTSLVGIRDLSVMETPPPSRQSIRTVIAKFSDKVIRDATLRELDRGGQIFFVHNKVRSINRMAEYIRDLAPEARVAVAHGQMNEHELESVMVDFVDKKFDVLVCTTIIESGLDIPSANTIIINRADHFGLSQLYQLRGRVGRDRHRAYGYFLIPGQASLTDTAKKRLKALEELTELGSGFKLAARDMEIRGAGNLLGAEQSGHIEAVGFEMYCEMLEDTIRELKGEPATERFDVNINLNFRGRIAPEYVPDLNVRMELYSRINEAETPEELDDFEVEILDRFGPMPEDMHKLIVGARIRLAAKKLKIERVDIVRGKLLLMFHPSPSLDPAKLLATDESKNGKFRFTTESTIEYTIAGDSWSERKDALLRFLAFLMEKQG